MSSDDSLEACRWVFHIVDHGIFDVCVPHNVGIGFVLLLAFVSALLILKAWFVEVYVLTHDNSLN
jgi:hypothetical protein